MADARVAYYGDDFTGSVDVLLQFARRGWTGRLFTGLPTPSALRSAAAEVDVVGIAGIARSLTRAELDAEVSPALRALAGLGVSVVQYKACSTADSLPEIGSLGRVIELARDVFGTAAVPMLFAQPDFGRHTVFGHHFAREGDTVFRLDRQPTMSRHPSTPMTESDLAVHIGRQTALPVGSLPFTAYSSPDAIRDALRASDAAALVLDAVDDAHVELVGRAVAALPAPAFAIGSGGLSAGLAAAWGAERVALPVRTDAAGPVLAVSGSRSPQTRRQVDDAVAAGWDAEPLALAAPGAQAERVVAALREGRSSMLTSDDLAGDVSLEGIAAAAASVILVALRAGVTRRVVVCGGDTSSRVTRLLGVDALSLAANPEGNVVLLRAHSGDPAVDGVELLLKGGQVGAVDLLARLP